MTKTAVGLYLMSPSEVTGLDRAGWAEERGFDSVWIPDGGGKMHALTLAGAVASRTTKVRVGTGIVPVFTHTPAVLASSALTLAQLAPGRVILGLGASTSAMIEGWHGIPYVKPLTRVRETTLVLRRMLAGEKVAFEGQTLSTRGFRMNPPPRQPPEIFLAALRPKMLELVGEIADGVILHLCPAEVVPRMLDHIRAGAEKANRSLADIEITLRLNAFVGDDISAARDHFRQILAGYFSSTAYNRFFSWCGREAEAHQFAEGFREGDREKTRAALNDGLVESLGLLGPAEKCREELRALFEAGIQTAIINPISPKPEEAQATFEALAPEHFA